MDESYKFSNFREREFREGGVACIKGGKDRGEIMRWINFQALPGTVCWSVINVTVIREAKEIPEDLFKVEIIDSRR